MEVDWIDWGRNLLSLSGAFWILRLLITAVRDGVSRVWNDCVARDRAKMMMRARSEQNEYDLKREFIRSASGTGAYERQFNKQDDE